MPEKHLEQFRGKASVLVSEKRYIKFIECQENIGYKPDVNDTHGSMYVSTSDDIDKALKDCNGDISKLETSLGFPEGHFGNGPVIRVDINNPEYHGLRMANGKEAGSNEFFNTKADEDGNLPNIQYTTTSDGRWAVDTNKTEPGELSKLNGQYINQNGSYHPPNTVGYDGKTSGGMSEAVINQVPNNAENVSYTKIDGFKRGESSDLKTSQLKDGYSTVDNPSKINSQSVASEKGGGARAPNNNVRGNTDNPPKDKTPSKERGTKPALEGNARSNKETPSERGQKPFEGENKAQGNNSIPLDTRPQEAPQNTSYASQTQKGTCPSVAGDSTPKAATEQTKQNIVPKSNGMGM